MFAFQRRVDCVSAREGPALLRERHRRRPPLQAGLSATRLPAHDEPASPCPVFTRSDRGWRHPALRQALDLSAEARPPRVGGWVHL